VREGTYARKPTLPHVLGVDPAGTVAAVGEGVRELSVGDRVFVHGSGTPIGVQRWGGYAEYLAAPIKAVCRLPDALGFREATVLLRHLPTAHHLVHAMAQVQRDEWVLVMGASGGLAACCIQVARRLGAKVIGAAGSDARVAEGIRYGAHHGINYRTQDLAAEVMKLTGEGVHVVAENVGDPVLWPGAFNSLRSYGRLVTAGAHAGGNVTLDLRRLYLKRITIKGDPTSGPPELAWALDALKDGTFIPPAIDRVMPLREAAAAHRLIETRAANGKVLLDPTL
jgi:NADPH:quinone reductase-like Zn-dependent oxidoreductase